MNNGQEILLFGGNANPELAEKIASYLGRPLGQMICTRFSDGEVRVQVLESARGMDVMARCACKCWRARGGWMCSSCSRPVPP